MRLAAAALLGPVIAVLASCASATLTDSARPSGTAAVAPSAAPSGAATLGAAPNPFTGSFVADARPSWIGFLSLTQSGATTTGFLATNTPDGKGGLDAYSLAVKGVADGNALTLSIPNYQGSAEATLTGRRSDDLLLLTLPTASGTIANLPFARGSQDAYNLLLENWRGALSTEYQVDLGGSIQVAPYIYVGESFEIAMSGFKPGLRWALIDERGFVGMAGPHTGSGVVGDSPYKIRWPGFSGADPLGQWTLTLAVTSQVPPFQSRTHYASFNLRCRGQVDPLMGCRP